VFGEFTRAMAWNDLGQDFFLHKTSRPIARGTFFLGEKLFDAVIIQGGGTAEELNHAGQCNDPLPEYNAPSFDVIVRAQQLEIEKLASQLANGCG
jgi:hypothetical protein